MNLRRSGFVVLLTVAASAGTQGAGLCTLDAAPMAFPAYAPISNRSAMSTDRTSDARVLLTCTGIARGGPYSLRLSSGNTSDGVTQLTGHAAGGLPMRVVLYQDAAHTVPWTPGTSITGVLPPGDSRHTHVVFGRIPALQTQLRAGAYYAQLMVTLDYNP